MSETDTPTPAVTESKDDFPEYEDRKAEELEPLREGLKRNFSGYSYVAKAAPGYNVHGVWHTFGTANRSGYATHAMSLHHMLSKVLGVRTELQAHRNQAIDIDRFPEDRKEMLEGWMKDAVGLPEIFFQSLPPESVAEMSEMQLNLVPYCAFEGTRVSELCERLCNSTAFAEVWVVSEFVRDAMIAGGVHPDRVRTIRPMLTDGIWQMSTIDELKARKNRPVTHDDPFVFTVLGTWQKRKGMHELVKAYFQAFKREEPVRLVIRTSAFGDNLTIEKLGEKITKEVAMIAAELGDDNFPRSGKMPRLGFQMGTSLTDQQVISWLGDSDCYVNPSFGEGLGIPHTWAKAQGVPMVTSGYGAVGELITEIDSNTQSPSSDVRFQYRLGDVDASMYSMALMFDRRSQWGLYNTETLGNAMRQAFQQQRVFDEAGALYVRQAFSAETCSRPVREGLRSLLDPKWIEEWKLT